MTGSKDPIPNSEHLKPPFEKLAQMADAEDKKSVKSRGRVSELLVGVDHEIEQMRQRMQRILTEEPSPDTPLRSGEFLEELVLNLREANEHLVIASINANTRETQAAQAHERQTLFLSMLAHELRNPLAPIAMSVELLGRIPDTSPAAQSLLDILARQTTHLTRLIDDLMDATRINNGKIRIDKTAVLLSELITQAVETSQPLLDIHHQPVSLDLPPEPVWIDGDLVRLSQLFSNLIINASKFSADLGCVKLSARLEAEHILVSVKDEGIGIAPELQPFIFDLFTQGPVGIGLMAGGLGIGLSLVKTIAQLHGGSVDVVSKGVGQGSEFIVTLPVVTGAAVLLNSVASGGVQALAPLLPPLKRKQILLIDDNPDVNLTLSEFLGEVGHDVECAVDGPAGLKMENLHPHNVICCDIGLPGMDGYEVARRLRHDRTLARLIAISGYDQPEQRSRAFKAGFNHYLVKPIFGQELLALIDLQDTTDPAYPMNEKSADADADE